MRPIRTTQSNFTFTGPVPDIADLPGHIDFEANAFMAVYELDDEEREQVANGGQIQIGIHSLPIPPVSIGVVQVEPADGPESPEGVPIAPDFRCDSCGALYVNERAIALSLECGRSWCNGSLRLPGAAD